MYVCIYIYIYLYIYIYILYTPVKTERFNDVLLAAKWGKVALDVCAQGDGLGSCGELAIFMGKKNCKMWLQTSSKHEIWWETWGFEWCIKVQICSNHEIYRYPKLFMRLFSCHYQIHESMMVIQCSYNGILMGIQTEAEPKQLWQKGGGPTWFQWHMLVARGAYAVIAWHDWVDRSWPQCTNNAPTMQIRWCKHIWSVKPALIPISIISISPWYDCQSMPKISSQQPSESVLHHWLLTSAQSAQIIQPFHHSLHFWIIKVPHQPQWSSVSPINKQYETGINYESSPAQLQLRASGRRNQTLHVLPFLFDGASRLKVGKSLGEALRMWDI